MRLLVHDFAGHPFQVQLSRELANRNHEVTHAYPIGLQGPKGRLEPTATDPANLKICGIELSTSFAKYSALRRLISHRQYARDLKALIARSNPDVVLSGNTPIDVQAEILWHCRRNGIGFVHWVQDIYSHAIEFFLRGKIGPLAGPFARPFLMLEKKVSMASDGVVVIAEAFKDLLIGWGVPHQNVRVIENWSPLEEMPSLPRENSWSLEHDLHGKTVFLYSGTLGLKHRPDLMYKLAESLDPKCRVVVISEGVGRHYLANRPTLENLVLLDFQPYSRLPEVLASADVLLATLEKDAGQFAVPSKILSYLCAGRPILLAAPAHNLAASVVTRSGAGSVTDPDEISEWLRSAQTLASDAVLRASLSESARAYAEETFDIKKIGSTFETVLLGAQHAPSASPVPASELPNET